MTRAQHKFRLGSGAQNVSVRAEKPAEHITAGGFKQSVES
jgi:hypothetical protein